MKKKGKLSLFRRDILEDATNVHFSRRWEWLGVTTVFEEVRSFITGKWWLLSALKN